MKRNKCKFLYQTCKLLFPFLNKNEWQLWKIHIHQLYWIQNENIISYLLSEMFKISPYWVIITIRMIIFGYNRFVRNCYVRGIGERRTNIGSRMIINIFKIILKLCSLSYSLHVFMSFFFLLWFPYTKQLLRRLCTTVCANGTG